MLLIFCGLSQLDNCPVRNGPRRCQVAARNGHPAAWALLSAAERRGTPVLLSASVSDNFGNSPQIAAPRRSREIDQSTQRFYVGWFHVGWQGIGDQSDVVTQNAWFLCCHLW